MSDPNEDSARARLREWFTHHAPALTDAYDAAVRLLGDCAFPASASLICHIVRDILNLLPEALDGEERDTRVDYRELTNDIARVWPAAERVNFGDPPVDAPPDSTRASGIISQAALDAVQGLLRQHGDGQRGRWRGVQRLLNAIARQHGTAGPPAEPTVGALVKEYGWFQGNAHLRLGTPPDFREVVRHFEQLELTLDALTRPFFTGKDELDAILDRTNRSGT